MIAVMKKLKFWFRKKSISEDIFPYIQEAISLISSYEPSPLKKKYVWQLWWQGTSETNFIVDRSWQSVKEHLSDFEQIILTKDNIQEYVEIPKHIKQKHDSGLITHTHFSDILRSLLLEKYGGIWADSTVFFSSTLPKEIADIPLFVFQDPRFRSTRISSWFIRANPNHPIFWALNEFFNRYWEVNDELVDYFLIHHAFVNLVLNDDRLKHHFDNIPFMSNQPPHYLQFYTVREKNIENAKKLLRTSFIHKLTYKNPLLGIEEII